MSEVTNSRAKLNGVKRDRDSDEDIDQEVTVASPKRLKIQSPDMRRPSRCNQAEGQRKSETLATQAINNFSAPKETDLTQNTPTDSDGTGSEHNQSRNVEASEDNQTANTIPSNGDIEAPVEGPSNNQTTCEEPPVDEEVANRPVAHPENYSRLFDIYNRWERVKFTCRIANIQDNNRELTQDMLQEEREIRRWMTMSRAPYPTRWEKQIQCVEDNEEPGSSNYNESAVNDSRKLTTFGISIDDGDNDFDPSDDDGGDTETVGSLQRCVSHIEGKKALHWNYMIRYAVYHTHHPLDFDPENALDHPAMAHIPPHLRAAASEYLAEMLKLHASESVSEDEELSPEGVIANLFAEVQAAEAGSAYALEWQTDRQTRNVHAKLATRLIRERANERAKKPEEPEPEWLKRDRSDEDQRKKKKVVSFGVIPPGHDDGQHTRFPRGGDKKRHRIEAHNILGDFREHMERENARLIEFLRSDKEEKLKRKQEVTDPLEKRTARVSEAGPSRVSRIPTPPLQEPVDEIGATDSAIEPPRRSGLSRMDSMHSLHDMFHASESQMRRPSAPASVSTRSIPRPPQQDIPNSSLSIHLRQGAANNNNSQQSGQENEEVEIRRPTPSDSRAGQPSGDGSEKTPSVGASDHVNTGLSGVASGTSSDRHNTKLTSEESDKSVCSDESGKGKERAIGEKRDDIFLDSQIQPITPPLQSSEHSVHLDLVQSTAATSEVDHDLEEVKRDPSHIDNESSSSKSANVDYADGSSSKAVDVGSNDKENTDDGDEAGEMVKEKGLPSTDSSDSSQDSVTASDRGDVTDSGATANGHTDVDNKSGDPDFVIPSLLSKVNDDWLFGCSKPLRAPKSAWGHRYRPYRSKSSVLLTRRK